jgi:hypothetical protein
VIAEQLERWGYVPHVVTEVFGTDDGDTIERLIDAFCAATLGSAVATHELFDASSGSVHGVRLVDGRLVVVKARTAATSLEFLGRVQAVQRHLRERGFPAPEPIAGPKPLGAGVATAETFLDVGERGDPHEPPLRRALAHKLARLVDLCEPLGAPAAFRSGNEREAADLWPVPHDGRFDFEGTTPGAEWIDEIARRARQRLGHGSPVLGHLDWRAENVRFSGAEVVAVFDWDSLGARPEAELVGEAAHYFPSDFRVSERKHLPSLDEALAFVDEYECARGIRLDRDVVQGALVYAMAYTARCEHSDAATDFGRSAPRPVIDAIRDESARAFLKRYVDDLL